MCMCVHACVHGHVSVGLLEGTTQGEPNGQATSGVQGRASEEGGPSVRRDPHQVESAAPGASALWRPGAGPRPFLAIPSPSSPHPSPSPPQG